MHLKLRMVTFSNFENNQIMKLLTRTENKITKDKNGENLPCLEIPIVIIVHCNTANYVFQQD